MNEVKSPRRPLMWFYGITLAIIILFNLVFRPMVAEAQIKTALAIERDVRSPHFIDMLLGKIEISEFKRLVDQGDA